MKTFVTSSRKHHNQPAITKRNELRMEGFPPFHPKYIFYALTIQNQKGSKMTSKYGALLKNEKTRRAVYSVLQDIFEAHHVKCFEAFRSHFSSRGNLDEMEKEFQTFLRTARRIFDKDGGEFSNEKIEQAIPSNKWMAFHETYIACLYPELVKNSRFIRRKKDHQQIYAEAIKKAKAERVL